jgi:hypothetical protein
MPTTTSMVAVDLIAGLKDMPVSDMPTIALVVGGQTLGDGLGGLYRWYSGDASTEDTRFFNVVTSNTTGGGRWIRIFQRVRAVAGGYLVTNGGFKEFFMPGTLNASGQIIATLTMDGTSGGTPIFTEVWTTQGDGAAAGSTANDSVIGTRRSLSNDLRSLTYQFVRGSNTTLTGVLGLVIPGLQAAPQGTAVVIRVSGI